LIDGNVNNANNVTDGTHDDESQAYSLAKLDEFLLVRFVVSVNGLSTWLGKRTFLATVHKLGAFFEKLLWDIREILFSVRSPILAFR
jgi:hypothetical protein